MTASLPTPSRHRSPAMPLLALALLASVLLASVLAWLPVTSTATPAPGDSRPTPDASFGRGVPPTAEEDFARLPLACYESDRATIRDVPCRITRYGPRRPTLVAWGDSHAQMYLPALRRLADARRVNLTAVVLGSCPVALPLPVRRGFGRSTCEKHNVRTLDFLRGLERRGRGDVHVLIGGFWAGYRDAYRLQRESDQAGTASGLSDFQQHMSTLAVEGAPPMFARLGRMGLDVDLVAQAATVPLDAPRCRAGQEPYQCDLPRSRALTREQNNRRWIKRTLRRPLAGHPHLIDATPGYCTARTCRAHVGGITTFYDDLHLGARLAGTLRRYFVPVFTDLA